MAWIRDFIDRIALRKRSNFLRSYGVLSWDNIGCLPFGEMVFQNIVEMVTDLNNDVTFTNLTGGDSMTFAEFNRFFEDEGEAALWRVYRHGFAVIGLRYDADAGFVTAIRLLNDDEWKETTVDGDTFVTSKDPAWRVYVMKSQTYAVKTISDYALCRPAVEFLDNTLNASNTSVKKLGAFVVASPETSGTAPTPVILNKNDKQQMEDEISKEYGLLNKQRQIMLLPRGMKFQTVSLTGIDNRLTERVRMCVELIADRIKVPASQISVIDATAGKSLANGGEIHEGDRLKYKTYERLLDRTFVAFARSLGLEVTYEIYNKPADAVTGQISENG